MTDHQVAEAIPKYLTPRHSREGGNPVPAGYKQTEVGVIPEDWEVRPLSDLTVLMTNGFVGTAKSHYTNSHEGIIYIQGYNVIENGFNFHGIKKVTPDFHKKNSKSCLKTGDVLMVQTGDVGLVTIVPPELNGSNCHALIINRFKSLYNPQYFSYLLNSKKERQRLKEIETGTTMKHINIGDLLHFLVPFPKSKKEQTAIANALSDVDALISELEKLIAKKQAIKTATMQQLLTGRTRLPQFALREDGSKKGYKQSELGEIPEDWEEISLGSLVVTLEAGVSVNSLDKTDAFSHGKHILKTSCVDGGYFDSSEIKSILPRDVSRAKCFPVKNAIIISRMNTPALVGELGYVPEDCPNIFLPDRLWQIRFKSNSELNSRWLSYLLSFPNVAQKIKESATGTSGSMKNIAKNNFLSLKIPSPLLEEQTAIAKILSDMDEEIQALEQRLTKTRQIKQGMMQELLTGKTRLIKEKG